MAKIVGYKFEDNDSDIDFLKDRFGEDLNIFSSEYEREHRPGSIYGFGSFELLPVLCEHPEWLNEYWRMLIDHLVKINSRWSEDNRNKIINASVYSIDEMKQFKVAPSFLDAAEKFNSKAKVVDTTFQYRKDYSNRQLAAFINDLTDTFVHFVDVGDTTGSFSTLCQVDSEHSVRGYHFTAGFFLFLFSRIYNQPGVDGKFLLQTPFFYSAVTYALNCKGKAEKGDKYKYKTKEMPESVDQFVLQKLVLEGSNTQGVSNLIRDTYIKAWVYHKLMACEDGKVLTQKSLVADLKVDYKAIVKSLPLSTRDYFSERATEGDGDSTYHRILKEIRISGYLRSKIKELVLEAVM